MNVHEAINQACAEVGCGRRIFAKKLCHRHYALQRPVCAVAECDKPIKAYGYCSAHSKRFRKYGDPLGGGSFQGEPLRWLREVAIPYAADDCLTWPFGGNGNGYGRMWVNGRKAYPHRVVCEAVHGVPSGVADAAHSCGNGHLGCVNPRHLRWTDRSDNLMDRVEHNTHNRGEKNPNSKLTPDDVRQIRACAGTTSLAELARRFRVSRSTIRHAIHRESWKWL